jgi:hypothetical protein
MTIACLMTAFVMWQSYGPTGVADWHPMDTFETLEACKAEVAANIESAAKQPLRPTWVYVARCLPDTIDPRGGKVR